MNRPLPERLLIIVDGERYPRKRTFIDQTPERTSWATIKRALDALVADGQLEVHRRPRGDTFWCVPGGWSGR